MIYGTAWKEDDTSRCVRDAIAAGFRAIDTANQRKHYFEAAVGEAIGEALAQKKLRRDELFIQTKFTSLNGQDHRLPYDPRAPLATQVQQSFAKSLEHLGVTFIDSYVLHGPQLRRGLGDEDWEIWRAMEELHAGGKVKQLGVSNVSIDQLRELHAGARVKPAAVQNRCFASMGWDRAVRAFCSENHLAYQGFSLLTANRDVLASQLVRELAAKLDVTVPQVIFRFALDLGMTPLTGTTSRAHMAEDLAVTTFMLDPADVRRIESIIA
jgi:diketogulonate reductase-like aldo/keto reductase